MTVERVLIVVPARDEETTLRGCLESIATARAAIDVPSTVVVVLDACTERSEEIARGFDDVLVVDRDHRNVGRSRHDAVCSGLSTIEPHPSRVWIAFTDADSAVPPLWLHEHLAAAAGSDAYVGAVVPRLAELDAQRRRSWLGSHPPGATLGHVHGASLGVRADAYGHVGGFLPLDVGEDVDLVARLRAVGFLITESERHPVITTGRLTGRAPAGYAAYLHDLAM
ncbi:glycosyltransferase [Leifsonia sp. McL0607]|uniref:glycosyltransferase n=1 Tax=Leifsonia sp. McL0607 TaxID=3415672 RepID=UPI003CF16562